MPRPPLALAALLAFTLPIAAQTPHTADLALVIYTSANEWQEIVIAELPVLQCIAAMQAIWVAPLPVAFTDEDGNDVKAVDAWCGED